MKTFVLNITYSATGEGISNFLYVDQSANKETFLDLAAQRINPYYLLPFQDKNLEFDSSFYLYEIEKIPNEYKESLALRYPMLANFLVPSEYPMPRLRYFSDFHANMS